MNQVQLSFQVFNCKADIKYMILTGVSTPSEAKLANTKGGLL